MKKIIAFICVLTLVGCSTFKSKTAVEVEKEEVKKEVAKQIDKIPEWYIKPPKDKDALYEKAVAKSRDMQMAMNKATMLARAQLAVVIQGEVNAITRLFMDENGDTSSARVSNHASVATSQEAILVRMNGAQQENAQILQEGDKYVAYVLIMYPIGEMNRLLVEQIRQTDAMNSKVRADEAYDEIERKIQERRKLLTN